MKRMLIWTLSFVFILSMISLTLAQTATAPAKPAGQAPPQITYTGETDTNMGRTHTANLNGQQYALVPLQQAPAGH